MSVVCVAGLTMAAGGCGGGDAGPATVTAEVPTTTVTAETPPETEARTEASSGTTTAGDGSVTLDGQTASVTVAGPEDDVGTAWKVEVTREDDVELDVARRRLRRGRALGAGRRRPAGRGGAQHGDRL